MRKSSLPEDAVGMRIDKWLWAARFFKTRSIAKHAIEGGKVHHNGERVKVSREVRVGMELTIQQGIDKKPCWLRNFLMFVALHPWHKNCMKKPKSVLRAGN